MFRSRRASSNAAAVTVLDLRSGSRTETAIEGARRAYLAADPLDCTATIDFIASMAAVDSNPSDPDAPISAQLPGRVSAPSRPCNLAKNVDYRKLSTDSLSTVLASCGCRACRRTLRETKRCPMCGVQGRRCDSCRPPGAGWRWNTDDRRWVRADEVRRSARSERRGGCSGCETAQTMGGECYRVCSGRCMENQAFPPAVVMCDQVTLDRWSAPR